jgi:hypothetical protein
MRLLISLCNANQYNSQFSLAVIDTESGERWLVDCGAFLDFKADNGITGLLQTPHGLAVAIQSNKPRVTLLDPDFRVVWAATDERLADVHSLSLHPDGRILAMSSGRNKILDIDPKTGATGVFWEYAPMATPFLHINSLAFLAGQPVVCSHKLPPEAKHPSETGGVWKLKDYSVLMPGLKAPHTLTAHDGGLVCLSSANGRVASWKDGVFDEKEVPGYVRGLLLGKDQSFIGSSALRFISRKAQGIKRYADFKTVVGNPAYMSSLVICDRDFREIRRIGTTFLNFEIYDVVADPGVPASWLKAEATAIRMQTMQRLTVTLREQLQAARHRAGATEEEDA